MEKPFSGLPKFRDQTYGWLHFAALGYAFLTNVVGLFGMYAFVKHSLFDSCSSFFGLLFSIVLSVHGKVISSYLVHEAAHGTIFEKSPIANESFGALALVAAGCPYLNFRHIRKMHICHHKDRADVVEFDYRQFVLKLPSLLQHMLLAAEFLFVPVVEIIHHVRAAAYPIFYSSMVEPQRVHTSLVGGSFYILYSFILLKLGIFVPHVLSGILVLHILVIGDAFHHTYQAVMIADYVPGPGDRTAAYEEENTFSNLISTTTQVLNVLVLNFGYHNAHHQKPMTAWYNLPKLHDALYDSSKDSINFQVLPYSELIVPWYEHRLRRVTDEDYGAVGQVGTPKRAKNFVGALGVSFLTV